MNRDEAMLKAAQYGAVLGRGAANAVAKTGEAGRATGRGAKNVGTFFAAFGSGIKQGWKDQKQNILTAKKVEEIQKAPIVQGTIILTEPK